MAKVARIVKWFRRTAATMLLGVVSFFVFGVASSGVVRADGAWTWYIVLLFFTAGRIGVAYCQVTLLIPADESLMPRVQRWLRSKMHTIFRSRSTLVVPHSTSQPPASKAGPRLSSQSPVSGVPRDPLAESELFVPTTVGGEAVEMSSLYQTGIRSRDENLKSSQSDLTSRRLGSTF